MAANLQIYITGSIHRNNVLGIGYDIYDGMLEYDIQVNWACKLSKT